jgi:hypothetical protein
MPTTSIARPSKIYPNWDFWFEKIPSGNREIDYRPTLILAMLFKWTKVFLDCSSSAAI